MFDTTYRVVLAGEPKDETVFGSDVLAEAEAEYLKRLEQPGVYYLMHRARIIRRSDKKIGPATGTGDRA
jgi:hypothetical protein